MQNSLQAVIQNSTKENIRIFNSRKCFVKTFFQCFIAGILMIAFMNYICDPLQYYRFSANKSLNGNDRWQVAGFIRSFDFNQVVIGTSMTQNFSLEALKNIFHTKPIRLSVAGLSIQEQSIILRSAIKTGKVKSVIWGIDRNYLNYEHGKFDTTFPLEIYRQGLQGHLQYLLNVSTLSSTVKYLSRLAIMDQHDKSDLEYYNAWHRDAHFSREIVLKLFNESLPKIDLNQLKVHLKLDQNAFKNAMAREIKNFQQDILDIIQQHPDIHFYIFYPPYSLAYYKLQFYANSERFDYDAQLRQYMLMELCRLPNVSFHDFEVNTDIVANLDNYKDLTHYSKVISDLIIKSIGNKRSVLKLKDINKNQARYLTQPLQSL